MARDLKLQVLLNAVDNATAPLKKISRGSEKAAQALKASRDELKTLEAAQKDLRGFRQLKQGSEKTATALGEQQRKVAQLTREIKNTSGPTKQLNRQREAAIRQARKLKDQYQGEQQQLQRLKSRIRDTHGITGKLAGSEESLANKIRAANDQLEAQQRQLSETGDRMRAQQDALERLSDANISGRFSKMNGEIGRLGRRTLLAGGAAAGGIFALANSTATLGDDVAKNAAKMGIGIGALQELRYAAERSGVSTQKLDSSTERFVKRLGEARQGGGAAAKAYEQLGLNASQLAELTPDAALGVVADRLAQVENHTDKVALAAKFFGREGVAMVNMLKDGSSGLNQLRKDARETGYVLSDKAARDAETFKDALLDAELGMAGIKNTIGAELMPAISEMMGDLSGWMRENRDQVKAFAREFGGRLKAAIPAILDLGRGVAAFVTTLGEMITKAAAAVGGFDNLAMIVGGLFASKAIASVLSFGVGIGKAIGALAALANTLPAVAAGVKALSLAFAATPIGWIVAGIAAVAGAAYLIYRNWGSISEWFSQRWADVKAAFSGGIGGVARLLLDWSPFGLLWRGISSALGRLSIDLPASFTDLGSQMIRGLGSGIKSVAGTIWGPIKNAANAAWNELKTAFNGGIAGVTALLIDWSPLGLLWRGISEALAKLGVDIPKSFSGMGGWVIDGIKNGITGKLGELKKTVTDMASNVGGWFKDKLGINSPSRVFASFGGYTVDGLNQGLDAQRDEPARRVRDIAKHVATAGAGMAIGTAAVAGPAAPAIDQAGQLQIDRRPAMTAAPTSGGGLTITGGINIEIHAAQGMDEQALAREVNAQVQRALREAEQRSQARRLSSMRDID